MNSYKKNYLTLEVDKPCKRLEEKFDLPFIGKTTYNSQYIQPF
jgi:hypothetical protein